MRDRINIALPVVVCPGTSAASKDGAGLEVDIDSGAVKNLTTGLTLRAEALPPNIPPVPGWRGLVEIRKAELAATASHAQPLRRWHRAAPQSRMPSAPSPHT